MKELDHADLRHLTAADGWLGLSDMASASDELDQITATPRPPSQQLPLAEVRACLADDLVMKRITLNDLSLPIRQAHRREILRWECQRIGKTS